MSVIRRGPVLAIGLALLATAVAGCDPQLAGSLTGPTTLFVEFPDAQDLVHGHTVQIGNVAVGSVRSVELVRSEQPGNEGNYAARVKLSIVDGRDVPIGTTATLRRTSLLGEHFVDLTLPPSGGTTGPFYEDGDTFAVEDPACTGPAREPGAPPACIVILDDFEDVALNAAEVFGAVAGRDLNTIITSAHQALNGRGPQLNALIADLSTVVGEFAAQRSDLLMAIDGLAVLGATLAPASEAVGALIDDLGATSALLADHRQRIVTALTDLTDLATSLNDVVLEPHAERLGRLLRDLDPVVATLADNRQLLDTLITDLLRFSGLLPQVIGDTGKLNAFAYLILGGATGASADSAPTPVDPLEILRGGGAP